LQKLKISTSENGLWPKLTIHNKENEFKEVLKIQTHSHKYERMQKKWIPNIPKWETFWKLESWNVLNIQKCM
jgi:hypothetical protein